jgi:hypothetical protein
MAKGDPGAGFQDRDLGDRGREGSRNRENASRPRERSRIVIPDRVTDRRIDDRDGCPQVHERATETGPGDGENANGLLAPRARGLALAGALRANRAGRHTIRHLLTTAARAGPRLKLGALPGARHGSRAAPALGREPPRAPPEGEELFKRQEPERNPS